MAALIAEIAHLGRENGKLGGVILKRRTGRGTATPRLVVMTEGVFRKLINLENGAKFGQSA